MHTNNTAYKACIWKFWIHNLKGKDDRLNIALYCFEAMNSKISGYFLVYLLSYISTPAILYYKTTTLSEWWSSPSMETCPVCRFNMFLYNHIVALFFIINWCVGLIFFLVFATGIYFYHQPIYFNSTVMASTTTIYILPLIYILKFYIFSRRDLEMDNESQYHDSVIKNCELN
ncbi:unnamed protein product [Mytilus coruscus]|uniref:Uncharacterized protein n=1 Tax=Mytilus coruscus TaxID=42192 RepID=A0A6J8AWH6_MYTCO|nr:unnamed protein product [Mytilus coruscus]